MPVTTTTATIDPPAKPPATPVSPAPLTTAQKLEALRRVQAQAEQRVKLGTQLLKAAESHTSQTQTYVEQVRQEQNELREKLEHDVAAALHQYDQWVGTIDESLTRRLQKTEERLDDLDKQWAQAEQRIIRLVKHAELMFSQSRSMLETATTKLERLVAVRPTRPADMPALKVDSPMPPPLSTSASQASHAGQVSIDQPSINTETPAAADDAAATPTQLYAHLMKRLRDKTDEQA